MPFPRRQCANDMSRCGVTEVFGAFCICRTAMTPCGVEAELLARRAGFACFLAGFHGAVAAPLRCQRVQRVSVSILRLPRSTNVLHRHRRRRGTLEWS